MHTAHCHPQQFRSACGKFPTGVTVTTVLGMDEQPYGITLSSFTSVSLHPPLVLVCIDHRSQILDHFLLGQYFGINILSEHQRELSVCFSGDWKERFSNVSWSPGMTGVPLLSETAAFLECHITRLEPVGDHRVVIGQVVNTSTTERLPLAYCNRSYSKISSQAALVNPEPVR
jgi:flavin reductase (DIM6/NTAB) family NADH-FMN oxidoreductase RutF